MVEAEKHNPQVMNGSITIGAPVLEWLRAVPTRTLSISPWLSDWEAQLTDPADDGAPVYWGWGAAIHAAIENAQMDLEKRGGSGQ